jgi:hypothetical protein
MYKKAHAAIRADPEAKSKPAKEVTTKRSVYLPYLYHQYQSLPELSFLDLTSTSVKDSNNSYLLAGIWK